MTKLVLSFLFLVKISLSQNPIESFDKWKNELDNLYSVLGEWNKASAELIIQVYNSNNNQAKGFIKN